MSVDKRTASIVIRADDVTTFGYLGCLTLLVLVFHHRVENAWLYPIIHLVWAGEILLLIRKAATTPRTPWIQARNWYHALSIPMAFRELHYLVHPINPVDVDPILIQWDLSLFGVHPTVWLEGFMTPWLTEYLQIIYTTFYFLPLILGILLWRGRHFDGFQATLVGIVTAFYLSYLGYFAFPALGPRFELAELQTRELEGLWLTGWLRGCLDSLELIQRDAFPSGHVGVSLLVLHYARKYQPRTFVPFLIVVVSLVVSTVYLRYHYVVDLFSGVALALIAGWGAHHLRSWFDLRPVTQGRLVQACPGSSRAQEQVPGGVVAGRRERRSEG